jgi:hypothetical protein
VAVDALAVALHFELLQVRWQAPQGAVIGGDVAAAKALKVAVPDIEQAQPHRQIALRRCAGEVPVHLVRAGQEPAKFSGADGDRDR